MIFPTNNDKTKMNKCGTKSESSNIAIIIAKKVTKKKQSTIIAYLFFLILSTTGYLVEILSKI